MSKFLLILIASLVVHAAAAADGPRAAAAAPQGVSDSYMLYPGDLVEFRVFDHPDLATSIRVPREGSGDFPLIGAVLVTERQLDQVTTEISRRLQDGYVRNPKVSATVTQFGARQVYVTGNVAHAMAVELNPVATLTAAQAIGQAGGFLADANRAGVHVLRAGAHGERSVMPAPLADDAAALTSDVALKPGDIVVVPRLDKIYVLGQVERPGALDLPAQESLTVSKAITMAGGFGRFAKQGKVTLIRDGAKIAEIDVKAVLRGDKGGQADSDPVLKPGDTVFVPESRF